MTRIASDILPFRFLTAAPRARFLAALSPRVFHAGELLVALDARDDPVFLLESGEVEVIDTQRGRVVGVIEAGHYFGERAALFDTPRQFQVRASSDGLAQLLPSTVFIELLHADAVFANALANILREKQGIFFAFESFITELNQMASSGHIVVPRLLHRYRPLAPALHHGANSAQLDTSGLSYAVARLPHNVTRTLSWFVVEDLPYLYSRPHARFLPIETRSRRRTVYEMLPGKSLVLLRDGISDLADFVTCLCLYAVEARKIRQRLADPDTLHSLLLRCDDDDVDHDFLASLPFSSDELSELGRIWPTRLDHRLREIALHHEDFALHTFKTLNNYNSAHSETWTEQVAAATRALLGVDPADLERPVHILSSNTHSVPNCLSSYLTAHLDEILAWGAEHQPELVVQGWAVPRDLGVALLRHWLRGHPERKAAMHAEDRAHGVVELQGTAFTGIGVQLFDTSALQGRAIDPDVVLGEEPALLVNIDYAFGEQADPILSALVSLFGRNIRSINVLGKAGGLQGVRGDVLVASALLEQDSDVLRAPPMQLNMTRLRARIPDRSVHQGPMLTVLGTLLQNRTMLQFYRHLWRCIGLEMEGSYYCREILQSQQLGILRPDVALRFLYYTSDLPLQHDASLSQAMGLREGIPPLYAITREVLTAIGESDTPP